MLVRRCALSRRSYILGYRVRALGHFTRYLDRDRIREDFALLSFIRKDKTGILSCYQDEYRALIRYLTVKSELGADSSPNINGISELDPFSLSLTNDIFDFFFFNDTATTEIYTLSLHDALPI